MSDDAEPQGFRTNGLVERMRRYIPLDAGADQLVHELVDVREAVEIKTKADDSLLAGVRDPSMRLVLLTGDAGHGKTRLCCHLLEDLGIDKEVAAATINNEGTGGTDLLSLEDGRALRIVKDLSDVLPEEGAELVVEALDAHARVTVVCVNEGRLRDLVSKRPDRLDTLLERLERGLSGDEDSSDGILLLNLNFQSVASLDDALIEGLLQKWVGDGRSWTACSSCKAKGLCPIYENRRLLADDIEAVHRTGRWAQLLRLAERTGVVVTIREMLVMVAFALTSGLRCANVHAHVEARPVDRTWQWKYVYSEALFNGIGLLEATSPDLRVPAAMRRLDPGHFADRRIDEGLGIPADDTSFRPIDPTGDVIGIDWREVSPERARDEQLRFTRFLRRKAFFDDPTPAAAPRVGLRFGQEFEQAASDDIQTPRQVRDRVVRGLASAQGLTNTSERLSALPVVEPALAGRTSGVAILDRDIRLADIEVMSLSSAWAKRIGRPPQLLNQVDWVERAIAVVVEGRDVIEMDLRAFELVCAAGEGLDLGAADPGVSRRLLLQLAALAGRGSDSERIEIVEPGQRWTVDLDFDDQLIGDKR